MYANYWGLDEIPFRNTVEARWFYESPFHEEALARLLFLVEHRRRCGLLLGPAGTGKTLLLEVLRRELTRSCGKLARIDACGRSSRELLWEVTSELGLCPRMEDGQHRLWRRLDDHLQAARYSRASTVLLLDHVERAPAETQSMIERLGQLSSRDDAGFTIILGVRGERPQNLSNGLLELADLRMELTPLDRLQTEQYVETLLFKAGATRTLFEVAALERLFLETAGVPRALNRLCDMALLAGMAERAPAITESIVAGAAEEVSSGARRIAHGGPHSRHRTAVSV
ncbi:MAG: AAA family ATPase [Planctomycetes bacterium]|nr:AAA family ATPase [Planctomycetota bacterium]